MKPSRQLAALLLALAPLLGHAAATNSPPLLSGVNDVQFEGAAEQSFLGSGFVIEHNGRYFGVTAKHVLLMRDGGPPANTDIEAQLSHWHLRDPRSKATVAFGRLLNGNAAEAMTPDVLKLDTLVFELTDSGPFQALRLAADEPQSGDSLHAIGCAYASEASCAQDRYDGTVVGKLGPNLLIDLGGQSLDELFGLSGAPVLNDAGKVVGIVSNVLPDSSGEPRFAPVDIGYLREILDTYSQARIDAPARQAGKLAEPGAGG
jgi:hypothetical protein